MTALQEIWLREAASLRRSREEMQQEEQGRGVAT